MRRDRCIYKLYSSTVNYQSSVCNRKALQTKSLASESNAQISLVIPRLTDSSIIALESNEWGSKRDRPLPLAQRGIPQDSWLDLPTLNWHGITRKSDRDQIKSTCRQSVEQTPESALKPKGQPKTKIHRVQVDPITARIYAQVEGKVDTEKENHLALAPLLATGGLWDGGSRTWV